MKKIFNKKSITILLIILYILSIILFEIGYCNAQNIANYIVNRNNLDYNFSLVRIIFYIIAFLIIIFFKNKFIDEALKVSENKYKRIFIYISIIATIIMFIAYITIIIHNPYTIRGITVGLLALIMWCIVITFLSNNIAYNTILILLTFGIIFSIATPFNHAVDEKKHFMSAFNVANFNLDYSKNPITDKKIENISHLLDFNSIDTFLEEKYIPEITNEVNMEDIPSTPATYPFISYIFPAIGIGLAKLLGGSIIDMYILGRIFNLILYAILVVTAIKIIPFKKNIFAIICCMPYAILLSASYSVDGFCIGLVLIFIAYCLKVYKEKDTISLKDFIILFSLFVLMLTAKSMAYLFVALIAFILPIIKTIKNNKKYIPVYAIIAIIMIICVIMLAWYVKSTQITSDTRAENVNISVEEQLKSILTNPKNDIVLIFNHIGDTLFNFNWYATLHSDVFFTPQASYTMFAMLIFILYVSITEDDYNFNIKNKLIMSISFLLVFVMTSIVLYLSFTTVGATHINGYQARYILPILPLLLFSLSSERLKATKSENRSMNICIISSIFVLIGLFQLLIV